MTVETMTLVPGSGNRGNAGNRFPAFWSHSQQGSRNPLKLQLHHDGSQVPTYIPREPRNRTAPSLHCPPAELCPCGVGSPPTVPVVLRQYVPNTAINVCSRLCPWGILMGPQTHPRQETYARHSTTLDQFALSPMPTPGLSGVCGKVPRNRGNSEGERLPWRAVMVHDHHLQAGSSRSREPVLGLHSPTTRARHVRAQSSIEVALARRCPLNAMRSQPASQRGDGETYG